MCHQRICDLMNRAIVYRPTCGHHADGGMIHHADDSNGHADTLSEHVEKHEETDDGKTKTRGAEK